MWPLTILLLKLRDGTLYDDARMLSVELSRAAGNAQAVDLLTAGDLLGGLPLATYEHVAGEVTLEEAWRLHVAPAAVVALPTALRETVLLDGVEVTRLRAEQIEDMGLLLHYEVS